MSRYDCDVADDERKKAEGIDGAIERKVEELISEHLSIDIDSRSSGDSYGSSYTTVEVEVLYKGRTISMASFQIRDPS